MFHEVAIVGIYFPPLFISLLLCLPLLWLLRQLLARSQIARYVWHPALVEFSLVICVISLWVRYV